MTFATGLNRTSKNIQNKREIVETCRCCSGPRWRPDQRVVYAVAEGAYCMASLSNSFS